MHTRTLCCLVAAVALAAGCAQSGIYTAAPLHARTPRQDARANLNDAIALVAQRHYEEAAERLSQLLETLDAHSDPTYAEALFWLAYCHEKQDRIGRAVSLYQSVIRTSPESPAARQATDRLSRLGSPTPRDETPNAPR